VLYPPAPPYIIGHHLHPAGGFLSGPTPGGRRVRLLRAPVAAPSAGVGYLQALGEALEHELLIDCRDDAGLVMAALRTGCRTLIFSGPLATHRRLAEMAAQIEAEVRLENVPPSPFLTLSPDDDGIEPMRRWLAGMAVRSDVESPTDC
jgi:hypothetical protein